MAVKINGEKLKIKGDSIDHIVFWPTKYPDNPQIICWHTYGSIDNKTGEYKPNCGHNAKRESRPSNGLQFMQQENMSTYGHVSAQSS